ncbi:MAG: hypothetical protein ACLQBK_01745 [Candidatus Sulfotelmatobacter sp.]
MLKSDLLPSTWKLRIVRASIGGLCLLVTVLTLLASGSGQAQDFTLQMAPFPPPAAVNPGGNSASNITLGTLNGFNGTVDLGCQLTPQPTPPAPAQDCEVSPLSVNPPGSATATVTATDLPPGLYTIMVTGTASGTTNSHSAQQNLTVLAVTPNFTITVTQTVQPSSVHAGSGGQGVININPLNGYIIPSGGLTLYCATVTPLVTLPPACSFSPSPILSGTTFSTLSIGTVGPIASAAHARPWYALWLPLPMLALAGLGLVSGRRSRAWSALALFVVGGAILLMPACAPNNTISPTNTNGQITPKNTYTFTIMGIDSNGVSSSNTGTSAPTVTLTVD